ncbi:tyrosine-type recombinase/integrase [Nonomuraea sp. CA-141351]|uniref:tyrosine-type recombinase/integrase n=1 Tax=Nonomuraea sp. CA-141351 TaxID=3239996 RepID=UPI003D8E791F
MFYSGLRVAEPVALDVADVPLSAHTGKVIVRNGKGETSREVPLLDTTVREAIKGWKTERSEWLGAGGPALFLNRCRGGRLSARAVDQLLDELAAKADLVDDNGAPAASAHTLRHTFATNLLRQGVDIVVVAELMGHARLDTTRRYTNPQELHQTGEDSQVA